MNKKEIVRCYTALLGKYVVTCDVGGGASWTAFRGELCITRMRQTLVGRVEERNPTNDPILKINGRLFCIGG